MALRLAEATRRSPARRRFVARDVMGFVIPAAVRQAIVHHAIASLPNECCGLLAADASGIRMAYPLTNADHSPVQYTIEPSEHFGALRHAERQGWSLVGAFHSHPTTRPYPSPTDVRLAGETDWLYVIVGLADVDNPELRAYRILDRRVTEVEVR
jgi:proteasome lid subunit RPN8/RPN11